MKKLSLICVATLLGMSLAGCGNSSSHKATSASRTSSSKVVKHHKKTSSSEKHSSSATSQQAVSQSTTQQSNTNQQIRGNAPASGNDSGQDQRPADVPANFKEYVSYTTDGHRMTQWNDAGQYEGDPDVQYQTIKAQTDAGF